MRRRGWCRRAAAARSIGAGSSLAPLQVDTLADALVAARPSAEVYSFSLKDRGALFGAGRRPKVVLWLDTEGGTLVTSTAFATACRRGRRRSRTARR